MDPIFTIDVGAGTTDVLVYLPDTSVHYKAVAVSPVKKMAEILGKENNDVLVTGMVMGGGAVSKALTEHARKHNVYMTPEAAKTVHYECAEVERRGIKVISEKEAAVLGTAPVHLVFGDVCPETLKTLVECLGIEWRFSFVGGAVQDHGACPHGADPLEFRHQIFKSLIDENPRPERFLLADKEIPEILPRMRATAGLLSRLPQQEVFMIDTGMAATLGASLDPHLRGCRHCIAVDIGNSHTLAAMVSEGLIAGFFEFHTDNLSPEALDVLLVRLGNGDLEHHEVIAQGGHGAYVRSCPGFDRVERIVVTGPRRGAFLQRSGLELCEGAPLGDNMMTGASGILEAINRRRGLGIVL